MIFLLQELIKRENVIAVISMNEDHELKVFVPNTEEWARLGVEFLQLPTRDFVEVPSLEHLKKGVSFMERYVEFGQSVLTTNGDCNNTNQQPSSSSAAPLKPTVYVHCKAGRTRSATLVACYLVKVMLVLPILGFQISLS